MKPQILCLHLSYLQFYNIYIYMTNEGVEERFLRFVNVNHNRSVHCLAECFFIYYMNYLQTLLFANKNI